MYFVVGYHQIELLVFQSATEVLGILDLFHLYIWEFKAQCAHGQGPVIRIIIDQKNRSENASYDVVLFAFLNHCSHPRFCSKSTNRG